MVNAQLPFEILGYIFTVGVEVEKYPEDHEDNYERTIMDSLSVPSTLFPRFSPRTYVDTGEKSLLTYKGKSIFSHKTI